MRQLRVNARAAKMTLVCLGAIGATGLVASRGLDVSASGTRPAQEAACAPRATILESPRVNSQEVQVKALNDRGDVVGFADTDGGSGPMRAILWKDGKASGAIDLGVLPGYVASEAYGVNDDRVVFGVLYDRKERTFPFRWQAGHMAVLKGLDGQRQTVDVSQRNAINDRGEMAATLIIGGQRQAVRWSPDGEATRLPALPGHTWTDAFGINDDGVVSGWSRRLPNDDGEENPVIWDALGNVIALKTAPNRADGIAEATNRSGLTVGYIGNLGTDGIPGVPNTDPERDNAVVWQSRTAGPRLGGRLAAHKRHAGRRLAGPLLLGRPAPVHSIAELVDVNDRGQAAGMSGNLTSTGFGLAEPRIWRTGWTSLRPLPTPAAAQKSRVVVTQLNDINNRGEIVGNVYGLAAADYSKLRRIDPVLWTCAFGR